ncbi:MAG: VanZ family protein [Bacteroidota bacterium]
MAYWMMRGIKRLLELNQKHFAVLFFLWVTLITVLSLVSFSELDTEAIRIPFVDKITHFVFYFGFVFLGSFWLGRKRVHFNLKRVMAVFLSGVAYGGIMELLQLTLTQDRAAEWTDMLSNLLGASFAVLVVLRFNPGKEPLK